MAAPLKLYLAGPEVFLPDAMEVGAAKMRLSAEYGFRGLFPGAEVEAGGTALDDRAIYRACVALLRQADAGVVNLTPFRGPSADPGTVFEFGLMYGLGKPVFGYTNDARPLLDRVRVADPAAALDAAGLWRDALGLLIEDFGKADNLMLTAALEDASYPLVLHDAPAAARFHDLTGFEACLRQARAALGV